MPPIPYVVGQWVRGAKFYGRAAQLEEILDGPRNWIWLLGTRRLGKTSILKQLEHMTADSKRGFFPIFWDLEGADAPQELHEDFREALLDSEDRLSEIGVALEDVLSQDLFASLGALRRRLRSKGLRLLLLCDEVEALIQLNRKDPSLLRKLRRALQSHDDIRSVLSSTIRLWELSEQNEDTSPFLHGFAPPMYVDTLSDEDANALIRQSQLRGEAPRFEDATVERIRRRCDNHPYLLQLVCKRYMEMGELDEALEQVASDRMVRFFFSVDFKMLSEVERTIVRLLAQNFAATSDSIHERISIKSDLTTDSLHRLEKLGFIRRDAQRRFVLTNYFFRHWLRQTKLDELASDDSDEGGQLRSNVSPDDSRDRAPGLIKGRYELIERVGEGASGVVYQALDRLLNVTIAVKVLRSKYAENAAALERFRQETLLSRDIAHPNILRVYSHGEDDGKAYLTMQWVNGVTLAEKIRNEAPLPLGTTLGIAQKLASALDAAHSESVLHRDIKPTNILIDGKGEPYLMDFGLGRLVGEPGITQSGVFLGTPNYASPEQARIVALDHRSDLYSLGVVIFEMATATLPFHADEAPQVLELHKKATPPDPRDVESSVPEDLARIIRRCLAKDPDDRYQSAKALADDLVWLQS